MKTCNFSFMNTDYKISSSGDKKIAIKNFECLLMSVKSDDDIFNDFLCYGKKQSKYYARKHDYDVDTGARYIASGLIERYYKYLADFDDVNASARLNAFNHVYGAIYASLAQLNYSKCGFYSCAHWSTSNSGGKMIDIFDLLTQWENRQAKTESRLANYVIMNDAVKIVDKSRDYLTPWEKSCADKNTRKETYHISFSDYVETMRSAVYATAETEVITRDNINSLYYLVSGFKKEKSFERVADILHHGIKNKTDEKALERFRARHNLKNISADDLRVVFDITRA